MFNSNTITNQVETIRSPINNYRNGIGMDEKCWNDRYFTITFFRYDRRMHASIFLLSVIFFQSAQPQVPPKDPYNPRRTEWILTIKTCDFNGADIDQNIHFTVSKRSKIKDPHYKYIVFRPTIFRICRILIISVR